MDNCQANGSNSDSKLHESDEIEKSDEDFDAELDRIVRFENNREPMITSVSQSLAWVSASPASNNNSSPTLQFPSGGSGSGIHRPVPVHYPAAEPPLAAELPMPTNLPGTTLSEPNQQAMLPPRPHSNFVSSMSAPNLLETSNRDEVCRLLDEFEEINIETNEDSIITSGAPLLTWRSASSASYNRSSPTLQSQSGGNGVGIQKTAPPCSPILPRSTTWLFPEPNRQIMVSPIPRSSSLSSQSSIWTSWSSPTTASVPGSPAMILPRPAPFPAQTSTPISATFHEQASTSTPASVGGQRAAPDNTGGSSGWLFSPSANWQAMLPPCHRSSSASSLSSIRSSSSSPATVSGRASPRRRPSPLPSPRRRERRTVPPVKVFVERPGHNDVKLGKGSGSYKYTGNKALRQRAETLKARYKSADIRTKNVIKHELIDWVQNEQNGRFLEYDLDSGRWYMASEETVKDTVVVLLGRASK